METRAIKKVFGDHAYSIPVSSIKSMIGESFSASGALSLASVVGAMKKNLIPPTMNYAEKDPDCDLDYVLNKAREKMMLLTFGSIQSLRRNSCNLILMK